MDREDKAFAWIAGIGVALIVLHAMLKDWQYWPAAFSEIKTFEAATVWGFLLLVVAGLGYFSMGHLRSKTARVVSENMTWIYNSAKDRLYPAGHWLCRPVGGINAGGMSMEGHAGTVIAPKDAWHSFGATSLVMSNTKPFRFDELPLSVRLCIEKFELPAPYYFATAPSFVETRRKDVSVELMKMVNGNRNETANLKSAHTTTLALDQRNRILAQNLEDANRPRRFSNLGGLLKNNQDEQPVSREDRGY